LIFCLKFEEIDQIMVTTRSQTNKKNMAKISAMNTMRNNAKERAKERADIVIYNIRNRQNEVIKFNTSMQHTRKSVIDNIKVLLEQVSNTTGRENKIVITKELFTFLASVPGFIYMFPGLENVVRNKCIEFEKEKELKDFIRDFWKEIIMTDFPERQ